MPKKNQWELSITGFGQFGTKSDNFIEFGSSQVAVYAGNGQGKTCISRLFRAAEMGPSAMSDAIITKGKNAGTFLFAVTGNDGIDHKLCVTKTKGSTAVISNETNYLFHVFNSDYVRDNLAEHNYSPSGDIQGYIVGKGNIDVSSKKERLEALRAQSLEKRALLDKAVDEARNALVSMGIKKRTKGYSEFSADSILGMSLCSDSFDAKKQEYEALKDLPEDMQPLLEISFKDDCLNVSKTEDLLSKVYSRDQFSEEFINSIQEKRSFVADGMRLKTNDTCPFCGQAFNDEATGLIHLYEEYLAGREAGIIALIDEQIGEINDQAMRYNKFAAQYSERKNQYDSRKLAFSKIKEIDLPLLPSVEVFAATATSLCALLKEKAEDISKSYNTPDTDKLVELIEAAAAASNEANAFVRQLNAAASKTTAALRATNKDLCLELAKKVRTDNDALVDEVLVLREDYRLLHDEIIRDESQGKRPKRDAVAGLFSKLLKETFGDKYTFDCAQFAIRFRSLVLGDEAEQVLSDGEKTVVAFCYYVASTVELLQREDDTDRLFFVIDDPISSLDYHYVYSVMQIVRDLKGTFNLNRVRLLVLTHNFAFFNMLARNNVTKVHYVLHHGTMQPCTDQGIAPYTEHLRDLQRVSVGGNPTHTTGNSIRQVIETLWRFDNPAANNLSAYLDTHECADLQSCEYVYSLCQDQSHGASVFDREQPPDEDAVRRACQAVLLHINRRYPGQLRAAGIDLGKQVSSSEADDSV